MADAAQGLPEEVSELASDDDGFSTAIAAFFDREYVSPSQQTSELAKRARERARDRSPAKW